MYHGEQMSRICIGEVSSRANITFRSLQSDSSLGVDYTHPRAIGKQKSAYPEIETGVNKKYLQSFHGERLFRKRDSLGVFEYTQFDAGEHDSVPDVVFDFFFLFFFCPISKSPSVNGLTEN